MDKQEIEKLSKLIENNHSFVLTCHTNPDGDALGATLGLRQALMNMGKTATVITPDLPPSFYSWMKDIKTVRCYERDVENCNQIIDACDVVLMMDFNDMKRIKALGEKLESITKPTVMIDHHTNPLAKTDVVFSLPDAPATCEVAYNLLREMGLESYVDSVAATHFYTGIITDTGGLSYNSSNPQIYYTVASLLEKGIDKTTVHEKIFNNKTYRRLKLLGYCLSRKMKRIKDLPLTIMSLNAEELEKFSYNTGDTEGFVNYPLQIKDVIASALILERPDAIKISIRSKGNFPVNEFAAQYFGGGGHVNAAGASFYGTYNEAVDKYKKAIVEFYNNWTK